MRAFDLGGHSLIALRLLNEIKKEFSIELELPILFNAPSIRELARQLVELNPSLVKRLKKHRKTSKAILRVKTYSKRLLRFMREALERTFAPMEPEVMSLISNPFLKL